MSAEVVNITPKQSGCTVQFSFRIGQRVRVIGSSIEADVVNLMHDGGLSQYGIAYWVNSTRMSVWCFEREIEAVVV